MNKEQKEILENEIALAELGRQVLGNDAYKQAFTARKAKIFDDFSNSKPEEIEKRENAYRDMRNLMALEQYFNTVLSSGKMAEDALNQ